MVSYHQYRLLNVVEYDESFLLVALVMEVLLAIAKKSKEWEFAKTMVEYGKDFILKVNTKPGVRLVQK